MSPSAFALAAYAAWTLFLLGTIAVLRSTVAVTGRRTANSFAVDGADISPFAQRLCRAHANCYENLPIFASLVLVAITTGNAPVTDPLAYWVVGTRVAQSTTHLISTSNRAVQIRFGFFLIQFLVQAWWFVQLLWIWRGV